MVSIPYWLYALLLILSGLALLDRLLLPGVRWFLRRKVNEVLGSLHDRLSINVQPFKLTRRQTLIDRLVYDAQIMSEVERHTTETGEPREAAIDRVKLYAKEIVPSFNAYLYFRVAWWASKKISQSLYRVRLGFVDDESLRQVDANATVVFLLNHRSNMDYILVTYFATARTALSYAVGEWARIWPLQTLIRSLGAYFVRRRSGDKLYRKVLQRYVQIATEEGVTQAVFLEGGLSRDGRLRSPRLGLLDYLLREYDPQGTRDLVFIPVGINYDRSLEDRTLLLGNETQKTQKKPKKFFKSLNKTLRFLAHNFRLQLKGRWFRFGYACVNFGKPFSMKQYMTANKLDYRELDREQRFEKVAELANYLMGKIGEMVPVLPVSLVAWVMLNRAGSGLDDLDLKAQVARRIEELEALGAHLYIPRHNRDYAVEVGLRLLTLRHLVLRAEGLLRANPQELTLLAYYANSLSHFER